MKFVDNEFSSTLEIKRSKFITHICPYDKFDQMMQKLKDEHPKGRHFVYAYRYLNEFDQIVENSSDDGEPKGTSGKPSLSVLRGSNIINSAVIIVRYFGGIRLGTGGLVRAYGDAVNQVLDISSLKEYKKLDTKTCTLNYDMLGQIEYLLEQNDINILNKEFSQNVALHLSATKEQFMILESKLPLGINLND
ncbi:MAG: YigZ family protein [Campylobacterales bacterium]|nr:YigZ family protein [Campylobacterales bacterium]